MLDDLQESDGEQTKKNLLQRKKRRQIIVALRLLHLITSTCRWRCTEANKGSVDEREAFQCVHIIPLFTAMWTP